MIKLISKFPKFMGFLSSVDTLVNDKEWKTGESCLKFITLKSILRWVKKCLVWDLPGCPVVKTLPSNAEGMGLILGQRTKVSSAADAVKY